MNPHTFYLSTLLLLAAGFSAAGAHAIAITDVDFRILPGDYENADAAALLGGNDSVAAVNALTGDFAGDPWSLLDKTDEGSTPFENVTFELTGDINATSGSWNLSWSGAGLPINLDFLFVTKAAGDWGAYLFESMLLTSSPDSGDGNFEISWSNGGRQTPGLSHGSIYGRVAGDVPDQPPSGDTPPGDVPVPGSLLLLALGLGFLGTFFRRKRA